MPRSPRDNARARDVRFGPRRRLTSRTNCRLRRCFELQPLPHVRGDTAVPETSILDLATRQQHAHQFTYRKEIRRITRERHVVIRRSQSIQTVTRVG